jgi:hypothetical protein
MTGRNYSRSLKPKPGAVRSRLQYALRSRPHALRPKPIVCKKKSRKRGVTSKRASKAAAKSKRAIAVAKRNSLLKQKEWMGAQKLLLHDLTDMQQFLTILAQIVNHSSFKKLNAHLTEQEFNAIYTPLTSYNTHGQLGRPRFPADKPVFLPHALTTSGYGQLTVGGKRVAAHQVTLVYKLLYQSPAQGKTTQEIRKELVSERVLKKYQASHLMGGFVLSQTDINPNNLSFSHPKLARVHPSLSHKQATTQLQARS